MCGRFQFVPKGASVFVDFGIEEAEVMDELLEERYNVAPTTDVAVVFEEEGVRRLEAMRWGLIPPWATDGRAAAGFINARVETAAEKPTFRDAWKRYRCLVPVTGYYEWPKKGDPPTLVRRTDEKAIGLAGLWTPAMEGRKASCSLLTMESGGTLADLHHRMPVFLRRQDQGDWLVDGALPFEIGSTPVLPFPVEQMVVSKRLNKVGQEGPDLLEPDPEPPKAPEQKGLF
ncbi:MAG: SOS response-associated peptidase [Planctomycetota bacterium]